MAAPTELGLQDLSAFYAGGWDFVTPFGYYIHRGRVYLIGEVANYSGPVTQQILSGVPAEIQPGTTLHFTLYVDFGGTDFPTDPSLRPPMGWAATLTPSGALSLDDPLPDYVNSPPPGTYLRYYGGWSVVPRYSFKQNLELALSNISWPIDVIPDVYSPVSFAPDLNTQDFQNINATILPHDARLHFDGKVQVNQTPTREASYIAQVVGDPAPNGPTDASTYPIVTADSGTSDNRVANVSSNQIYFNTDNPPDYNQGTSWTSPFVFAGLDNGLGGWPDNPGVDAFGGIFYVGPNAPGGGIPIGRAGYDNSNNPYPPGGVATGGGLTGPITSYTCSLFGGGTITCSPEMVPVSGSYTLSVAPELARLDPQPDWIMIVVNFTCATQQAWSGCKPIVDLINPGGCQQLDCNMTQTISSDAPAGTVLMSTSLNGVVNPNPVTFSASGGDAGGTVGGYFYRSTPLYTGAPLDPRSGLLWKPGEITTVTLTWSGEGSQWNNNWYLGIVPWWEKSKVYFKQGDVIDFTGSGWPLPYGAVPVIPPSVIAAGIPMLGHVKMPNEQGTGKLGIGMDDLGVVGTKR